MLAPSEAKGHLTFRPENPTNTLGWVPHTVRVKTVGLLSLPLATLRDPLCIHQYEEKKPSFDAHVVAFTSDADDLSKDEAMVLARLRAIEHRVAVVVCSPNIRLVLKSNRYKLIQCFGEHEGVFGSNLEFLGGTYESTGNTKGEGIPRRYHARYRELLARHRPRRASMPDDAQKPLGNERKSKPRTKVVPRKQMVKGRQIGAKASWVDRGFEVVKSLLGGKQARKR